MANEKPDDVLAAAESRLHAAHEQRGDLLDVLFPRSGSAPSEMVQAQVRLILQRLVLGIERKLTGDERKHAESWQLLSTAGLLREPGLIDFALARIAESRLRALLDKAYPSALLTQLPTQLLQSDQDRLADLSQKLLDAEQQTQHDATQIYQRLPAELLHLLCWRIVAALKSDGIDPVLASSAKLLLAAHEREQDPFSNAEKLIFFLGPDYREQLANPKSAGLSLFVAALARDTGQSCDRIVQLIGDESPAPLLSLLKAAGLAPEMMGIVITHLRGAATQELADAYAGIDAIEARAMLAKWREEPAA